jgi:hypothetical protein
LAKSPKRPRKKRRVDVGDLEEFVINSSMYYFGRPLPPYEPMPAADDENFSEILKRRKARAEFFIKHVAPYLEPGERRREIAILEGLSPSEAAKAPTGLAPGPRVKRTAEQFRAYLAANPGLSVRRAAKAFGIDEKTGRRWKDKDVSNER